VGVRVSVGVVGGLVFLVERAAIRVKTVPTAKAKMLAVMSGFMVIFVVIFLFCRLKFKS